MTTEVLTPRQKIRLELLVLAEIDGAAELSGDEIDDSYGEASDEVSEHEHEFRSGQVETKLPCDYSRHYESKSVAAKMSDGSWVGWTYWYGGGKHGEPEGIDWMEDAYALECTEIEKVVTVREFKKVG